MPTRSLAMICNQNHPEKKKPYQKMSKQERSGASLPAGIFCGGDHRRPSSMGTLVDCKQFVQHSLPIFLLPPTTGLGL